VICYEFSANDVQRDVSNLCDQVVGLLEVAGRLLASNTKELQQLQGL
jgi:hypothetical protein